MYSKNLIRITRKVFISIYYTLYFYTYLHSFKTLREKRIAIHYNHCNYTKLTKQVLYIFRQILHMTI